MVRDTGDEHLAAAELPHEQGTSRLLTWIGSTVDGTVMRAARLAIDVTLMPHADELPRMFESAEPFLSGELAADPASYLALESDSASVAVQKIQSSLVNCERLSSGSP